MYEDNQESIKINICDIFDTDTIDEIRKILQKEVCSNKITISFVNETILDKYCETSSKYDYLKRNETIKQKDLYRLKDTSIPKYISGFMDPMFDLHRPEDFKKICNNFKNVNPALKKLHRCIDYIEYKIEMLISTKSVDILNALTLHDDMSKNLVILRNLLNYLKNKFSSQIELFTSPYLKMIYLLNIYKNLLKFRDILIHFKQYICEYKMSRDLYNSNKYIDAIYYLDKKGKYDEFKELVIYILVEEECLKLKESIILSSKSKISAFVSNYLTSYSNDEPENIDIDILDCLFIILVKQVNIIYDIIFEKTSRLCENLINEMLLRKMSQLELSSNEYESDLKNQSHSEWLFIFKCSYDISNKILVSNLNLFSLIDNFINLSTKNERYSKYLHDFFPNEYFTFYHDSKLREIEKNFTKILKRFSSVIVSSHDLFAQMSVDNLIEAYSYENNLIELYKKHTRSTYNYQSALIITIKTKFQSLSYTIMQNVLNIVSSENFNITEIPNKFQKMIDVIYKHNKNNKIYKNDSSQNENFFKFNNKSFTVLNSSFILVEYIHKYLYFVQTVNELTYSILDHIIDLINIYIRKLHEILLLTISKEKSITNYTLKAALTIRTIEFFIEICNFIIQNYYSNTPSDIKDQLERKYNQYLSGFKKTLSSIYTSIVSEINELVDLYLNKCLEVNENSPSIFMIRITRILENIYEDLSEIIQDKSMSSIFLQIVLGFKEKFTNKMKYYTNNKLLDKHNKEFFTQEIEFFFNSLKSYIHINELQTLKSDFDFVIKNYN